MKTKYYLTLCLLLQAFSSFAQDEKEVKKQKMIWYSFSEEIEIRKKWHIGAEFEERHFFDPLLQEEYKATLSGAYDISKNWRAGIGLIYAREGFDEFILPEFRVEQEFSNRHKYNWVAITNRYKIEERFFRDKEDGVIPKEYYFSMRFRYRLGFDFTLAKFGKQEHPLKLRVSDELMVNAGKMFVKNIFDQNRFYAGISYSPVKSLTFSAGYMNAFKQRKSAYKYYDKHILRFGIEHELSFGKKKKTPVEGDKL